MGTILTLKDGTNHTILDSDGLMDLIGQYMGQEMRRAMEELLSDMASEYKDDREYMDELEKANQGLRDHHHEVMMEIQEVSEKLAEEIRRPIQDRTEISHLAGTIGIITGRELR